MKKQLLSFALGLAVMAGAGFTAHEYQIRKDTAEVNQIGGVFVFVDAKPVSDYEVLGIVKAGGNILTGSAEYTEQRDKLLKKAKKEYPQSNGLLINMSKGQRDQADVIKFK